MQLSSVYVCEHFLFVRPQVLNFGGKNFYSFLVNEDLKKILISIEKNDIYIQRFWNDNIQNISAVVGSNGAGKTNILKVINKSYQDKTRSVFIYEDINENDEVKIYIDNRTGILDENNKRLKETEYKIEFLNGENFQDYVKESFIQLYYSPIYDRNVSNFYSLLSLESNDITKTLYDVFSETILKQVAFLNNPISTTIKEIYSDFPAYKSFNVFAKRISKNEFTRVYSGTNIGNPQKLETLKNIIKNDLIQKNYDNSENRLKQYLSLIEADNLYDALQNIWNLPKYKNNSAEMLNFVHDNSDFIKNIEIILLSYLTLNDTFIITRNNGLFDFERILNSSTFEDFLDNFLKKYIISQDKVFESIDRYILVENSKYLVDQITSNYNKIVQINGVSVSILKDKMLRDIQGFNSILSFYKFIKEIFNTDRMDCLSFAIENKDVIKLAEEFFSLYSRVIEYFNNIPGINPDFLDIKEDINLSYGEKSLLNLYSNLFHFTIGKDHTRKRSNYLLILDEADLGYHPLWKKKYVDTLNKTLPLIFAELEPMLYNENEWTLNSKLSVPNLQIIFTTHDPLTLSDLPNNNVVYLEKHNGFTDILEINNPKRPTKTFGANITDLLADSFFISEGLIGNFAKEKIEQTIEWVNIFRNNNEDEKEGLKQEIAYYKSIIEIIDEPIVRLKLSEMMSELEGTNDFQKKIIENEIILLQEKFNSL